MSEQKKYLDNIGLETYDGLIKSYISSEVEVVKDAVEEIDLTQYETIENSTTKFNEAKGYTDTKTNGLASSSSVDEKISAHNSSTDAHSDIRGSINDLEQNKANTTHPHTISDVTNLQTELNQISEGAKGYTDLVASGKADTTHSHAISDVTNLQSSLDEKVSASRTINGKSLGEDITLSASDVGADASGSAATAEANARAYADTVGSNVKNDLLNGAGEAYDTLKELGELIDNNKTAIDVLEEVAAGKADKVHSHVISDVADLQETLNIKQDIITGGASTITNSNLTASRTLVSDANGKVAVSDVTSIELGYLDGVTSNIQTQLNLKANQSDIAATAMKGTATQNNTYWKISDFGNWGTGSWMQKGFSMLITSRAGEMVWVSLAANDSNTSAGAIRLINRYSKIAAIYYSTSESAIYVLAAAWANNICAHIISNVNGDYVPTVSSASGLPEDAVGINIVEFGITADSTAVGDSSVPLLLGGSNDRPKYNNTDLVLYSDFDGHKHAISDVTNLQTELEKKVDLSSNQTVNGNKVFTGTTSTMTLHTYNPLYINNSTDNTKNTSLYTNDSNIFAITSSADDMTFNGENVALESDINSLQTQLNGKAAITHTHAISDVNNLQSTLDGKAPSSHSHGYIQDGTVGLKTSDSNEVNFSSNANYIYFGYDNRMGSSGVISTYNFGRHNGATGSSDGDINCGSITAGRLVNGGKVNGRTVTVDNKATLQYDSTNECLNFTFA